MFEYFSKHYTYVRTELLYRKVRNLQIGVDKHVGKIVLSFLCHTKSAACIISMIIDTPKYVAYAHS